MFDAFLVFLILFWFVGVLVFVCFGVCLLVCLVVGVSLVEVLL